MHTATTTTTQQGRVPENFGDKGTSRRQKLSGKAQGLEHERRLCKRFRCPGSPNVGGTVVQHAVHGTAIGLLAQGRARFLSGDVADEGLDAADWLDGVKVNAHNEAADWHVLGGHLPQ